MSITLLTLIWMAEIVMGSFFICVFFLGTHYTTFPSHMTDSQPMECGYS